MKPTTKFLSGSLPVVLSLGMSLTVRLSPAQDLETEVRKMRTDLQALQTEVSRRAAREEELVTRVKQLETTVEEQQKSAAARDEELQRALSGNADQIDKAIEGLSRSLRVPEDRTSGLQIGGYFSLELRADQAEDHWTFDQHQVVLKLDSEITDRIAFRSEIEFEGGGIDEFLTDSAVVVEFAELHFHFDPLVNLKAGALLVPFNRFNYLHDAPLQELTDRPLVDIDIVPTTWTEAGVGLYGGWDFGCGVLDYDFIVSNGLDDDFESTRGGGFRDARSSFREDNNGNKMVVGRVGATVDTRFLDAFNVGFSIGHGKYDDFDRQSFTMWGFDWMIRKGPFELLGEYANTNLERGPDEIANGVPGGAHGIYAQANFHFFPECWRGTTPFFTKQSVFTLVFRYNYVDTDDSGRGVDRQLRGDAFLDDARSFVFGFNFRPVERTVIKLEYQWFPEIDSIERAGNDRLVFSFATYF
jgi:hypothetical protein